MKEKHTGTILVFVIVLVIIFLFNRNINYLYAALVFGGIGLFVPWLAKKIHWAWMKFAEAIGFVMNKVILTLVFFIILVPVAFLSRLFRKSPFHSTDKKVATYFTERNFTYTSKSLEEMW